MYRTAQLAKYLRTKGFCNIEYGKYELAAAFFMASLIYEPSELAMSEILYMKIRFDADFTNMDPQQAIQILESGGHPFGPHNDVVEIFCSVLSNSLESNDYPVAAQCAFVLCQITHDDHFKNILDELMPDNESE